MSFSEVSDAEPKSQILRTALDSFTCHADPSQLRSVSSEAMTTDEDVVGFDIGVHDVAFSQERQSEKHLRRVGSHSLEVDTDILSESFDYFS